MNRLKATALVLLPLAALVGCSNNASDVAFPLSSALAPVATGNLLIDHSSGKHKPAANVTSLRVTGLSKDGLQTITPAQTQPRRADDKYTVALDPRTKTVQIDYLDAAGTTVGQGMHFVSLGGGGLPTLSDPFIDSETTAEKLPASQKQYGVLAPTTLTAPKPSLSASPPTPLTDFQATGYYPLALPPQFLQQSRLFGPNPLLAANVTLPNLPPVGQQGTAGDNIGYPGTCIAWSFGYGLGSYTAAQNPDYTVKTTLTNSTTGSNLASPMYLYEVALKILPLKDTSVVYNGKRIYCCGSYDIYNPFMVGFGAATTSTVEYEPSCPALRSGANVVATIPPDTSLRLGSFNWINTTNQTFNLPTLTVDQIKQFLANGQAVAFGTQIWDSFNALPTTNGVYYGENNPSGGHGMLLVGYDDNLGAPGQQGAFLVQNSFGTSWPDPGAWPTPSPPGPGFPTPHPSPTKPAGPGPVYLAYSAFANYNTGAAVATPVNSTAPTSGNLTNPDNGPASSVTAYQVSLNGVSYLIFNHWFASPVELLTMTVTDPGSQQVVVSDLNYPMGNGYSWLERTDGKAFLAGTYNVKILAGNHFNGVTTQYTYTGNVTVGNTTPPFVAPAAQAAFPGGNQLYAVTGNPLTPATAK